MFVYSYSSNYLNKGTSESYKVQNILTVKEHSSGFSSLDFLHKSSANSHQVTVVSHMANDCRCLVPSLLRPLWKRSFHISFMMGDHITVEVLLNESGPRWCLSV